MAIALKTPVDPGDAPPMLSPVFMDDQSTQGGQQQQLARLPFMNSGPDVVQPSPTQQLINSDQAKLQKVEWNRAHPWGTPENHPGTMGKIAHVLSVAGNIAGNIVAPSTMALIPGSQLNMQGQEAGLTNRIGKEAEEESQNQARGAQTAKTQEETKEAPKKLADTEQLETAQEGNLNSEAAQRNEPTLAAGYAHAVNQAIKEGRDPAQDPIVQHLSDAITSIQKQPLTPGVKESQPIIGPDGKPHVYALDEKGNKVADLGVHYEKPVQTPGVTVVVPDPNNPGGGTVQRLTAGSTVTPGTMTPTQMGSLYAPTGQEKTAAGRAQIVLKEIPTVLSMIDKNAADMGPLMGRWNDFMQGKVGMEKPQFAGFRQNLMMLATAVAMAHAVGRLPENLREEFDRAINAPQQTPENLKAVITAVQPWMHDMAQMGQQGFNQGVGQDTAPPPGGNTPEPSRPANVPAGYKFNANGPKGAGWYK